MQTWIYTYVLNSPYHTPANISTNYTTLYTCNLLTNTNLNILQIHALMITHTVHTYTNSIVIFSNHITQRIAYIFTHTYNIINTHCPYTFTSAIT